MDVDEPGLFDMPDREPAATSERPQRGRNRETWARTVTAEVAIIDAEALHEAALRVEENALTIGLHADLSVLDTVAEADVEAAADAFAELAWLIWPADGLEGPLAAGAFQILSVDREAVAESEYRGSLTRTVLVKLTDVHELRRLAAQAHPEEVGLIADSIAVAWQRAADPFAPVRSTPGTAWRPGQVEIHHVPRRVRQGSAGPM
jgi:hypothetical protein